MDIVFFIYRNWSQSKWNSKARSSDVPTKQPVGQEGLGNKTETATAQGEVSQHPWEQGKVGVHKNIYIYIYTFNTNPPSITGRTPWSMWRPQSATRSISKRQRIYCSLPTLTTSIRCPRVKPAECNKIHQQEQRIYCSLLTSTPSDVLNQIFFHLLHSRSFACGNLNLTGNLAADDGSLSDNLISSWLAMYMQSMCSKSFFKFNVFNHHLFAFFWRTFDPELSAKKEIELTEQVERFSRDTTRDKLMFPPGLNSHDRLVVHQVSGVEMGQICPCGVPLLSRELCFANIFAIKHFWTDYQPEYTHFVWKFSW